MQLKAYSNFKKVKWIKHNQQFVIHTKELIESPAWSTMSGNCFKLINRLEIENIAHGGTENGNLIVTYNQLKECGIRKNSIKSAINEAVKRKLVIVNVSEKVSKYGKYTNSFTLTYLPVVIKSGEHREYVAPTNNWMFYKDKKASNESDTNISNENDTNKEVKMARIQ